MPSSHSWCRVGLMWLLLSMLQLEFLNPGC